MRLQFLPLGLQLGQPLLQLLLDAGQRPFDRPRRGNEVRRRIDGHLLHLREDLAADRLQPLDALHLVAVELDADDRVLIGGVHLQQVAAQAELATAEIEIAPAVHHVNQPPRHRFQSRLLSHFQEDHLRQVFLRRAETVDAGDAGDDHDVTARQQRAGGSMSEAVDLLVDGGIFLDIGVGGRQIRLRLVVVVVADEVFHGVVRQEFLELVAQLRRQRLVVRHHQRRPADAGDDVGHGESLAGTGDAQQRLAEIAAAQARHELPDRLRLVAGGGIVGIKIEL